MQVLYFTTYMSRRFYCNFFHLLLSLFFCLIYSFFHVYSLFRFVLILWSILSLLLLLSVIVSLGVWLCFTLINLIVFLLFTCWRAYICVYRVLLEVNCLFLCFLIFLFVFVFNLAIVITPLFPVAELLLSKFDQRQPSNWIIEPCRKVSLSPLNGWETNKKAGLLEEWMWKNCYQSWKSWEVHKVQQDHKRIAWEGEKSCARNQRELRKNSVDTIFEPYETIDSWNKNIKAAFDTRGLECYKVQTDTIILIDVK